MMNKSINLSTITFVILLFAIAACSDSGTGSLPGDLTGESVEYELGSTTESNVNGKILFQERIDGFTRVIIELNGLDEDEEYLVQVYTGTTLGEGELLIELDPIEGDSGESVQVIAADKEGETVTYEDLLELDAHIRVYTEDEPETILARIDIGENALTGESISFVLDEVDGSGVHGEVELLERQNGTILAVIELNDNGQADDFVARLYEFSNEEEGDLLFVFNSIDSESGISKTDITEFEDGSDITFDDLEEFEALLQIYSSEDEMTVLSVAEIVM
ncbi:MAG: hypothetical protein JJU37_03990 [Balneolaceae bacterium]|nr:hypothetical protein [Balneolaceae bacterium]